MRLSCAHLSLCGALVVLLSPITIRAQSSLQRYTVGGRDMVRVDIAGTPVGTFPTGIQMIDGIMEVIDLRGLRMLRASSRSTFLVQLPQLLPQDFTLEFELVPKAGGNPEDLAVEGTPNINQGSSSANVLWHRDYLQIVGGGQPYDSRVPPSFAATLPGVLTHVAITMQGPTLKLYTNGRLMYTQHRQFMRGRVLRVFLGGQDDGPNAVYLASMRVVDGVGPVGPIVAGSAGSGSPGAGAAGATRGVAESALPPSQNPLPNVGPGTPGGTFQNSGRTGAPGAPNTNVAPAIVTAAPWRFGISLTWSEVTGAVSYRVIRKETGTTDQGVPAKYMVELPPNAATQQRSAIDPHVVPGVDMTYWVEAVFADGSTSGPSPIASATPAGFPAGITGPANLQVSVGGTQNLTALNGSPGSLVTWTWDSAPSQYGYGVGVDILRPNQLPQAIRDYAFTPPASPTILEPQPATYTAAIPQGVMTVFCAFLWRTDDLRMFPAELPSSKPGLTCISAQVP